MAFTFLPSHLAYSEPGLYALSWENLWNDEGDLPN